MTFTILGRPVTKKNSQRIVGVGGRRTILQSRQYIAWEMSAVAQLRVQARGLAAANRPCAMRALVYRDRDVGDLLNYLAAVSDALERAALVENDRLIVSVDGSRMLIDRQRPRVEVELTAFTGPTA